MMPTAKKKAKKARRGSKDFSIARVIEEVEKEDTKRSPRKKPAKKMPEEPKKKAGRELKKAVPAAAKEKRKPALPAKKAPLPKKAVPAAAKEKRKPAAKKIPVPKKAEAPKKREAVGKIAAVEEEPEEEKPEPAQVMPKPAKSKGLLWLPVVKEVPPEQGKEEEAAAEEAEGGASFFPQTAPEKGKEKAPGRAGKIEKRRRALVTGATGKVGTVLMRELMDEDYIVRALVRTPEDGKALPRGVEVAVGDITRPETLLGCCQDVDVVFHLAALVSYTAGRAQLQALNGRGTANMVKEAREAGVDRFVYASSIAVYGKTERGRPLLEKDALVPTDNYGASKLVGENAVRYGNVRFVILRLGMVYGPGFEEGYMPLLKMLQRRSMPYVGTGKNAVPFVHVDDVVRAFMLAARKDAAVGETYNIVGRPVTQEDSLKIACKFLNVPPPRLHANAGITMFILKTANFLGSLLGRDPIFIPDYIEAVVVDRAFEIDKAQMELGWEPKVEIEDGIARMVEWYKESRRKPN